MANTEDNRHPLGKKEGEAASGAPEPPSGYEPGPASPEPGDGQRPLRAAASAEERYQSARKLVMASQICAIVSLLIFGIPLSTVGLVLAAVAYRRALGLQADDPSHGGVIRILKRTAVMAIAMCTVSLVLNVISFATIMPALMQAMNDGDLNSLLTGTTAAPSTSPTDTLWG